MKYADLQLSPNEAVFTIEQKDLEVLESPRGKVRDETREWTGESTGEMTGIIGQSQAMKLLRKATEITAPGYNVFVSGPPGTGRRTAVQRLLEQQSSPLWPRKDIVLVYNFKKPENPRVLAFPPGRGKEFKSDLHDLVENLKRSIPASLESTNFSDRRNGLIEIVEAEENRLLRGFEKRIAEEGFHLAYMDEESGGAMEILPEHEGKPVSFDVLQGKLLSGEMSEREWKAIKERYYLFVEELKELYRELRGARINLEEELEALRLETVEPVVSAEVSLLRDGYPESEVSEYLNDLETDLTANLYLFTLDRELFDEAGNPRFIRYGVNILEDGSEGPPVPVIWENDPTVTNLQGGTIPRIDREGNGRTSFLRIRSGSLLKAAGGFLILPAEELLRNEEAGRFIARFLRSGRVEIRSPRIKPDPIPADVRIIVIGAEEHYQALLRRDPDFLKQFKLHAVFTESMPRTPETTASYASFIRAKSEETSLPGIDASGICALLEFGIRLTGNRHRLSTRFSAINDCIIEAGYRAVTENRELDRETVRAVLEDKRASVAFPEETTADIDAEYFLARLTGTESGRITSIVLRRGEEDRFASPFSVSAVAAPARAGTVTIAGVPEAAAGIIEAYLRGGYATDFPLTLYADIRREDGKGSGDGSSGVSSAQMCALLSVLSEVPVEQNIAVLGDMSPTGTFLPVEGVTEGVERYFRMYRRCGIDGKVGVVFPRRNLANLLLDREFDKDIREGNLVLYAVSTVDEALGVLTGLEPAKLREKISKRLATFQRIPE